MEEGGLPHRTDRLVNVMQRMVRGSTHEIVLLDCGDGVGVDTGNEEGDGSADEGISKEEGASSSLERWGHAL